MAFKDEVSEAYRQIQNNICNAIEKADGASSFVEDTWSRPGGGGGHSRILTEGKILEKAGVNFSAVHGQLPDVIAKEYGVDSREFYATGVSIVMHPHNPFVPIIHMNIRYFEIAGEKQWFGGGIDLTPHYIIPSQAKLFHQSLKDVCDRHNSSYYSKFKEWADDYFYIPHRNETRGIGGIFYDHLGEEPDISLQERLEFSLDIGNLFAPIYIQLMAENANKEYTAKEKEWQNLRRGRYVEFNLVYDRGTKFGLQTSGRIESILMSLPKNASWYYNFHPEKGSKEEDTLNLLKKGIDWVSA